MGKAFRCPQRTKVVRRTLNPVWRQDLTFIVKNLRCAQFQLSVYDHDNTFCDHSDDLLGQAMISVMELLTHTGNHDIRLRNAEGTKSTVLLSATLGAVAEEKRHSRWRSAVHSPLRSDPVSPR